MEYNGFDALEEDFVRETEFSRQLCGQDTVFKRIEEEL